MTRLAQKLQEAIRRLFDLFSLWWLVLLYPFVGISGIALAVSRLRNPVPALRRWGAHIGYNTVVYPGIVVHGARPDFSHLQIGSNVRVVRECLFDLTDNITIEDDAIISPRCTLITHHNLLHSPLAEAGYPSRHAPIVIKSGAVLSCNVTVLMGVTIGECAMVAAGAVVASDVPRWTLVGGVPAKVIKHLHPDEQS